MMRSLPTLRSASQHAFANGFVGALTTGYDSDGGGVLGKIGARRFEPITQRARGQSVGPDHGAEHDEALKVFGRGAAARAHDDHARGAIGEHSGQECSQQKERSHGHLRFLG